MRKKTHEEYIKEVMEVNLDIEVIGVYVNNHTKILHRCKIDGYEWLARPNSILRGIGCPKCSGNIRKTHEEYIEEIAIINPNIEVVDKYINYSTKILHKCKICDYEWKVTPGNILCGHGCPVCKGKVIGLQPEYQNSIWASEYREYFSKYLSEEQMKKYMPNSNKKVDVVCKDCGKYHHVKIRDLFRSGLSCICSDGCSYPNKFLYNLLSQLKIEFIPEYSSSWSNGKKYDIFIPLLNCIIENHGDQHYTECTLTKRTLEEECENDKYKKQLAEENGIKHYVVIDCRKSNKEFIKKSILDSNLPILLSFNSELIDWTKCDKFATSNLIKIAADLWNDGLTTKNISEKIKVVQETVILYLKKAVVFGWCNYSKEESLKRRNISGANSYMAKKIIRLSDLHIYGCLIDAAKDNNVHRMTMTNYCKLHKGFMYYNDWINNQNIIKTEV